MLRVFLAANGTLLFAYTIIGLLRHCLLQDSVAQQILTYMVVACNTLAEDISPSLNSDFNVRGHTHMEIEDSPGLSSRS